MYLWMGVYGLKWLEGLKGDFGGFGGCGFSVALGGFGLEGLRGFVCQEFGALWTGQFIVDGVEVSGPM